MIPNFKGYIFDVDGTLVDSAADICGAIQGVLRSAGRHDISDEYLRTFIGRHLYELWDEVFPGCSKDKADELLREYRTTYLARQHAATTVFPGVREALAALRGRKATATTKSTETTRAVLQLFGLATYFDHIQGTDGFPAKPNPEVLLRAAAGLGLPLDDCLFIGDSPADMEAGKRAGMKVCAVVYGYGGQSELDAWRPDFIVSDMRELLQQRFVLP